MRFIAFDTETHRFRPGCMAPPVVCLTWCEVTAAGVGSPQILAGRPAIEALVRSWLADPDSYLIGANTSYDVLCLVASAADPHGMLSAWVAKYDTDRVSDVLIRQKLIDLARNCYRFERDEYGNTIGVNGYGLADLAWRHAKIELEKGKDNPYHPRLRYGEMDGVPLEQWPRDFVDYALEDATATGLVWAAQWRPSARIPIFFPGKSTADALADEYRQARADLWLHAMSNWGLKVDPAALEIFSSYIEEDYRETVDLLVSGGSAEMWQSDPLLPYAAPRTLARREYHFKRDRVLAYVTARPELAALCVKRSRSGPPEFTLGKAQRAALAAADPALACLLDSTARLDLSVPLGFIEISEHRNTKLAAARMLAWHRHNGTKPALTKTGLKKQKEAEKGRGPDLTEGECIALDKEACQGTGDELLEAYADMTHLGKIMSTDIPTLRGGVDLPIHTHYEVILDTGRTSSSKPNVQNQARGKKDRIGARECFIPRPGTCLIDSDYGKLELHTVAQVCLWYFGYSRLAESLNARRDPHTEVAAQMRGVTYEHAAVLAEQHDYEIGNMRNAAKPLNFGKWGGIGASKMTDYASRGYGVKKPKAFWEEQIANWERSWPESDPYFKMVDGLKLPGTNLYNVIQPWSGRLRAGATYCAACNSFFQGLGADVAKLAGWYIFKACYVDLNSPLFGARPVLFVHDQFLIEILEALAAQGAAEVERLMNKAGAEVLPDVPVRCEPILCRRYSKNAEKKIDPATGQLTAWEDPRLEGVAARQ